MRGEPVENQQAALAVENSSNTIETVFKKFRETFKEFKDGLEYDQYEEVEVYFDSAMLELDDTTDIELIIDEINHISRRIYMYGVLFESQERIVQQIEDEQGMWMAEKYAMIDGETETVVKAGKPVEKKIVRTEGAKEKLIMHTFGDDYTDYQNKLRIEKYKLGVVKRIVNGLDTYSYKLHSILNYRQLAIDKKL